MIHIKYHMYMYIYTYIKVYPAVFAQHCAYVVKGFIIKNWLT